MTEPQATQAEPETKRTRRFRKRTFKRLPPPALAVKPLWEQASEEEKRRAHQQCTTILQLWLGRITKDQAMAELELPALRLWQLSQQALSGMIAGLLKQPRTRAKGVTMPVDPENDPRILKKRIAQLERENAMLSTVNEVLRMLPANREKHTNEEATAKRPKSKSPKLRATSRAAASSDRQLAAQSPPAPAG